jgi:acid phosphatase type 7
MAIVLVGAGDIGACAWTADSSTARLLDTIPGTVFTTGDNAYPSGTTDDFRECYAPTWGRHRNRTRPSPGNHDYGTAAAAGYFDYFGSRAGAQGRGYYAYNVGSWRVYSLNSERLTDKQLTWLKADLAKHPARCSMAYWHRPRFSSGQHGNDAAMAELWTPLYRAGVELVVNGHDHNYERFALMRPDGSRYGKGIQQFVVGTGGAGLRPFAEIKPHSLVRQSHVHGVLKLSLRVGEYSWRFVDVDGSFSDTGTKPCHGSALATDQAGRSVPELGTTSRLIVPT